MDIPKADQLIKHFLMAITAAAIAAAPAMGQVIQFPQNANPPIVVSATGSVPGHGNPAQFMSGNGRTFSARYDNDRRLIG